MSFGGESVLRKLGLCGIHPLTRRYMFLKFLVNTFKMIIA
ncbi:DUF3265 domain-containing protein [Vibrio vulnificus]|nr:DUF3265 domain-containing protein [Vibrio vulnificus]EHH2475124.1 DUF3265 domain-containing protein [Vibrio vulnificus]